MIQSLKRKFVLLAMVSLCLLLTGIVSGMNFINYSSVVRDADMTLALLSENRGSFPALRMGEMPPGMSPEAPYEARFFSVLLDDSGFPLEVKTARIAAVDRSTAVEYAGQAAGEKSSRGFVEDFRYVRQEESDGTHYIS